jgi:hypothetical protein
MVTNTIFYVCVKGLNSILCNRIWMDGEDNNYQKQQTIKKFIDITPFYISNAVFV